MASTRKLSSDEVNALIEGLGSDSSSTASMDVGDMADIRPFKFGSDDLSLLGDYYALRMINERFARFARSVFLPMLRVQPRISSFPPEVKSFDEYSAGIDSFMSLNISRLEELRGNILTVLPPSFISVLTNSYYGGKIETNKARRPEFTATEERVIQLINRGINETLENSWRDLTPITLMHQSSEVNTQFASFVDGTDLVIICSFVVQLPDIDAASFDVIYPLQTLKPIAAQLRSRVQSDRVEDDQSWRDRMERAVLDIPIKMKAKLSEPVVPMSKLIRLQEGDVFPIQIGDGVEVLMDEHRFYYGEMGEVGGQSAINLTTRIVE